MIISNATRNPHRQIPSARPTKGSAFPESSGFSLIAPIAAAPIFPTAIPPAIQATPTAIPAAIYFIALEDDSVVAASAPSAKTQKEMCLS